MYKWLGFECMCVSIYVFGMFCLSGQPCKLFDGKKHPDYAPSHKNVINKQVKGIVTPSSAADRYERSQKREELKRESLRKELFETLQVKKQKDPEMSENGSDSCKPNPEQANVSYVAVLIDIDFEFNGSGRRFPDFISEEAFKDNDEKVLFSLVDPYMLS